MRYDPARLDAALKAGRIRLGRRNRGPGWCVLHSPGSARVEKHEGYYLKIDGHHAGVVCEPCSTFVVLSLPQPF